MKTRKMICVIICCAMILVVTSSCTINQNEKYKVLIAGSSDASNGLYIPVDINEEYHKNTTRDTDLWPDEITIQYEGKSYNCKFEYVSGANGKKGYRYSSSKTEDTPSASFTLDENRNIVSFYCNNRLRNEEKEGRKEITEVEATAIAEQVFRQHFDVEYSMYDTSITVSYEQDPDMSLYEIKFKKRYDPQIEIEDLLIVWVGFYGELICFNGLSIGSITPPEEKPDAGEIRECIVERIREILKDNRVDYSNLTVDVKNMVLFYNKKASQYRIDCVLSFDCKGIVDGVEQDIHDLIQVIVVCN